MEEKGWTCLEWSQDAKLTVLEINCSGVGGLGMITFSADRGFALLAGSFLGLDVPLCLQVDRFSSLVLPSQITVCFVNRLVSSWFGSVGLL